MKKLLALILALTMVFALAACGSEPVANSDAPSGDDVPSGEAVELTLTCNGTDQGNDTRSAKRFKELIEEETNGRITINIINNDQLAGGNMTSAIELLTGGGTDIDIHSTSIISSIAPEAMVCTMPWLFSDYQAAEDAFFGAGGEYMTELLSTKGVTYLGAVHNGFKLITNSKHPIEQPEDLAGLKIRIPGGDFFMDFYTAYGASPQAMSWSEVFTALQQGTIDGHDNSISTIVSNNVQEIQPYMTVSRHTYEAFTWMANTANFTSKLSEEDQQLVFDLVEQACKEVNAEIVAEEEELIAQCEEENGVQFYRFTDEDVETWRAVITDLIEEYKGVYGEAACTAFGVQ